MSTFQHAQRVAELFAERAILFGRAAELEQELVNLGVRLDSAQSIPTTSTKPVPKKPNAVPVVPGIAPKRRGRPPKNRDAVPVVPNASVARTLPPSDEKPNLQTLLTQISAREQRLLKIQEFVQLCHAAGYETKAKNFANLIYQALRQLCMNNILVRDDVSRDYSYVGEQAAA